jgi:hypothetical protein
VDPLTFEIARTLFAGISAAAAAIQVWYKSRDKRTAATEFDNVYEMTFASPEANAAATELVAIIPEEVIRALEERAHSCWTGFRKVLDPQEYLPEEVDNATEAVQACICRELGRIKKLNGSIPNRWLPQWQRYKCDDRPTKKKPTDRLEDVPSRGVTRA